MLKKLILILLFFNIKTLFSAIGCMDNSKHANISDGFDYHNYDFVACNCECKKQQYNFDRSQCKRCGHYRAPFGGI